MGATTLAYHGSMIHESYRTPRSRTGLLLLALAAFVPLGLMAHTVAGHEPQRSGDDSLPGEFEQILPRGRIPAVDVPHFVDARDAQIADDAWVLGVVVDGAARAYSLNLLNRHEVVNDRVNDRAFAAVW